MSRLRYNNSVGTLGGSLTSTGTTITFAIAPSWSTIVAPDYIPLVLEPPGATPNVNFEVVYVTAYTAGATTATIVRAQETTSPVSHSSGVAWMVAPTTNDFPTGLSYTPATVLPPSRAYRNAAFTFTTNTWTKVPLDTVSFDPNGYFSVAQGRYNVPAAGYYQVSGSLFANGQYVLVAIYKNGSPWSFAEDELGSGSTGSANVSDVVPCNAGDYLELWIFSNVTTLSAQGSQGNNLSVIPLTQQSIGSQITPVVARAHLGTAGSTGTGAQKVLIDTKDYDTSNGWDTTNHRFVVPVTGYYQVEGAVYSTATMGGSTSMFLYIYKNGSPSTYGSTGSPGNEQANVSDVIFCSAGDYLELYVNTSASFAYGITANSNFLSVAQIAGVPGANLAAARAYRNAALSLTASTWTKVPLDVVSFDPNGYMDVTTNHRYNVPAAGPYLVTGQVEPPGNSSAVGVYKNGSLVAQGGYLSGTTGDVVVTDIVQCNAGDYLELWIFGGSGGTVTGGVSRLNYFSVTPLVSAVASTPGFSSSGLSGAATNVARAYRAAALTLSTNTWQKVPLDTVSFDPSSLVSTVNGRINVGQTGYYQVNANVQITNGNVWVGLYKNGSPVPSWGNNPATAQPGQIVTNSDIVYCQAGDYLELWIQPGSGTSLQVGNGSGNNWLSVALVQPPGGTGNANALPAGASYQNGVINSTDLAISALSINTSTGALTFTLASAVPVIVKDASGLLIPVTFTGSTFTLIPPTLPTTSNSRVIGVEIDTNGQVSLVSGASVSGQQSTASTIETNTASITPGRLRVADIGVYNNAGAYNFSNASTTATQGTNWVDRRPWARRIFSKLGLTGGAATLSNTAYGAGVTSVGGTALQARAECSGGPVRVKLHGLISTSSTNNYMAGNPLYDGSTTLPDTGTSSDYWVNWCSPSPGYTEFSWEWIVPAPAVGSHLFGFQVRVSTANIVLNASASTPLIFTIEELLSTNANNGTV